jgi:hypothetical protein
MKGLSSVIQFWYGFDFAIIMMADLIPACYALFILAMVVRRLVTTSYLLSGNTHLIISLHV